MTKRIVCMLMALALLLGSVPAAMAREPKPVTIIPYDTLPEPLSGQHHYLLLCVDRWDVDPSMLSMHRKASDSTVLNNQVNTDGIVLVTLDTRAHRIMLTSIIRDALVWRPDPENEERRSFGRINYIAQCNSPETLCQVISEHIGVRIEKYILFSMNQISAIIDALGGVDIDITAAEATYLDNYSIPTDSTEPVVVKGHGGTYHFNGHSAVIYMRIRKVGGNGDFMRTQRVRTVLSTLADNCREISLDEAMNLASVIFTNKTASNASLADLQAAAQQAFSLRECTIEELRLPPDGAASGITYAGMAAQEVDRDRCRAAFAYYLENSYVVLDEPDDDQINDLSTMNDNIDIDFGD